MNTEKKGNKSTDKPASVKRLPPPVPAIPPKKVNEISKYFKTSNSNNPDNNKGKLYAQTSKVGSSTKEILKIKDAFPSLKADKIDNIQKIINGGSKLKPRINMTMKGPSRKQIIVPMNNDNKAKFMEDSSTHVSNLNRALRNIKSEVMVDFVRQELASVVIVTSKVASELELQTIENYIKNVNQIEAEGVDVPWLPQSKSYLKITGIPYLRENTNMPITSDVVEDIIRKNHIFNNVTLASRPRISKVSPKSDMAIVWINIWDIQSGSKAKGLINRCFNIGRFIATVYGANMNPGVPQCKNCWK